MHFYLIMMLIRKGEIYLKKTLPFLSCIAMLLVATAQTTMGTTCLFLVNQPRVPKCLLENDK